jgi:sterol desaturase/sphingolipid hydroxylase (fatty acid hydroxylase superfamily)
MPLWNQIVALATPWLATWGFAFSFMTALELLLSRGTPQPLSARLPGLVFWSLWVPVSGLVYVGFHALWGWLGVAPLIVLPLTFSWTGALAIVAAPIAGAIVYDFFFYWCHRAQHRWLWRFHAVHHSIRDLSTVNAYHHLSEPFVQTLLILLPTSLIVNDTGAAAPFMTVLIYFQASLIHSPVRLHLGPLRAAIADNRFHRIHHSLEPRHFDRNFGAFTTLWDRLFGTAYFPAADEWPDVGLAEIAPPRTVAEWLTLPLRYGRETAPAEDPATGEKAWRGAASAKL